VLWNKTEPTPGPLNNGYCNDVLQAVECAQQHGINSYVGIKGFPAWANGGNAPNYGPLPAYYGAWQDFVRRLVDALDVYGVRYYGVGNEVSLPWEFIGQDQVPYGASWVTDYERLLALASVPIHAKRPENRVVGYEAATQEGLATVVTESAARLADSVDVIAIHAYSQNDPGVPGIETPTKAAGKSFTFANDEWAALTNKEIWVTEFGGHGLDDALLHTTEMDQRNHTARVVTDFISRGRRANWTKIFAFTLADGEYRHFENARGADPSQIRPHPSYWAFRYLARRRGGLSPFNVRYKGYVESTLSWMQSQDGGWVGSTDVRGLWGFQGAIDPDLYNAGVRLCYRLHFGYYGWEQYYRCDSSEGGPLHWGDGLNHGLEAIRVKLENPLPDKNGGPMNVCGRGYNIYYGYTPIRCGDDYFIGTTGQARILNLVSLWLVGSP
jgi:hypothetical protein